MNVGFSLGVTLGDVYAAVEVRGLGVVGFGATFEEAMDDLLVELRAFAKRSDREEAGVSEARALATAIQHRAETDASWPHNGPPPEETG